MKKSGNSRAKYIITLRINYLNIFIFIKFLFKLSNSVSSYVNNFLFLEVFLKTMSKNVLEKNAYYLHGLFKKV